MTCKVPVATNGCDLIRGISVRTSLPVKPTLAAGKEMV